MQDKEKTLAELIAEAKAKEANKPEKKDTNKNKSLSELIAEAKAEETKKKNGTGTSNSEAQSISKDKKTPKKQETVSKNITNINDAKPPLGINEDFGSFLPQENVAEASTTRVTTPIEPTIAQIKDATKAEDVSTKQEKKEYKTNKQASQQLGEKALEMQGITPQETETPESYKLEKRKLEETSKFHTSNLDAIQQDLDQIDNLQKVKKYLSPEEIEQKNKLLEAKSEASKAILDDLKANNNLLSIQLDNDKNLTPIERNKLITEKNKLSDAIRITENGEASVLEAGENAIAKGSKELAKTVDGLSKFIRDISPSSLAFKAASTINKDVSEEEMYGLDKSNVIERMRETKASNETIPTLYMDMIERKLKKAPISNDLVTKSIEEGGAIALEYGVLSMLGVGLVPAMAGGGAAKAYSEEAAKSEDFSNRIYKSAIAGGKGLLEAGVLMGMGTTSKVVSNVLTKNAKVADKLTHLGVATQFGLKTYAETGDIDSAAESFSMGLAISSIGVIQQATANTINAYNNASPKAKEFAREVNKTPDELYKEGVELSEKGLKEDNKDLMFQGATLTGIASVKAFDKYAADNPVEAKKAISKLDLSETEKDKLYKNIDESVAGNIPNEAKEIDKEIAELNEQKEDLNNNESLGQGIKDVKVGEINDKIKAKEEALTKELTQPKEAEGLKEPPPEETQVGVEKAEETKPTEKIKEPIIEEKKQSDIAKNKSYTEEKPYKIKGAKNDLGVHFEDDILVISNNKGQKVKLIGGKKIYYDKDGNVNKTKRNRIDPKTYNKAVDDYISNHEFDTYKDTDISPIENPDLSPSELDRYVIENSTNPRELIETYLRELSTNNIELLAERQRLTDIADTFPYITIESYGRSADPNYLKGTNKWGFEADIRQNYLRKNGVSLDDAVTNYILEDVHGAPKMTHQEAINFMHEYPQRYTSINKATENITARRAERKFEEMTGLPLNERTAKLIADKYLSKSEQDVIFDMQIREEYDNIEAYEKELKRQLDSGELIINEKGEIQNGTKREETKREEPQTNKRTNDRGSNESEETIPEGAEKEITIQESKNYVDKIYKLKKEELTEKKKESKNKAAEALFEIGQHFGGVKSVVGDEKVKIEDSFIKLAKATFELTGLKGEELILKLKKDLGLLYPNSKEAIAIQVYSRKKAIDNAVKDLETPTDTVKITQDIKSKKITGLTESYSNLKIELDGIDKGLKVAAKKLEKQANIDAKLKRKKDIIGAYLKLHSKELRDIAGRSSVSLMKDLNRAVTDTQLNKVVDRIQKYATNQEYKNLQKTRTEGLKEIQKKTNIFEGNKVKKTKKVTTEEGINDAAVTKFTNETAKNMLSGIKINNTENKIVKRGEKRLEEREELEAKETLTDKQAERLEELNQINELGLTEKESIKLEEIGAIEEYNPQLISEDIIVKGEQVLEDIASGKIVTKDKYNSRGLTEIDEGKLAVLETIGRMDKMTEAEVKAVVSNIKQSIKDRRIKAKEELEKRDKDDKEQRDYVREQLTPSKTKSSERADILREYKNKEQQLKTLFKKEVKGVNKETKKQLKSNLREDLEKLKIDYKKNKANIEKPKELQDIGVELRDKPRKHPLDIMVNDSSFRSLLNRLSVNAREKEAGVYRENLNKEAYEKLVQPAERGQLKDRMKFADELDNKVLETFSEDRGKTLNYLFKKSSAANSLRNGMVDKNVVITIKDVKGINKTKKLTQAETAYYYNMLKSVDNNKDFFTPKEKGGMGWTEETAKEIEKQLDPKWKELADWMFDKVNNEIYDYRNSEYRKQNGMDLLKIDDYFEKNAKVKSIKGSEIGELPRTTMSAKSGSHIERIKAPVEIKETNIVDIYLKHTEDAAHYKNWAEPVRQLNNMFINAKTKDIINKRFGTAYYKNVNRFIERFAGDQVTQDNYWLDLAVNNFTKGTLFLSRSVGLKQLISSTMYLTEMNPGEFAEQFLKLSVNPKQATNIAKFLMDQTFAKYRNNAALSIEQAKKGKYSTYGESKAFNKVKKTIANTSATLGVANLERAASFNIRAFDKAPIIGAGSVYFMKQMKDSGTSWKEAKAKAAKLAKEENISENEALNKVLSKEVAAWDSLSSTTQQSNFISDISNFRADNPWARIFTTFTSGPSQIHRISMSGFRDIKKGVATKNSKVLKSGMIKVAIAQAVVPILYTTVANGMNIDWDKIGFGTATGNINGLPILGKVITSLSNIAQGSKFGTGQLAPIVDHVYNLATVGVKMYNYKTKQEKATNIKEKKKALANYNKQKDKLIYGLASMAGIPYKNMVKIYNDIETSINTDKDSAIILKTLLGLESKYNTGYDLFRQKNVDKKQETQKKRKSKW